MANGQNSNIIASHSIFGQLYNLDLTLDYEKNEIKWSENETVALTLKPDCPILDTRYVFNSSF